MELNEAQKHILKDVLKDLDTWAEKWNDNCQRLGFTHQQTMCIIGTVVSMYESHVQKVYVSRYMSDDVKQKIKEVIDGRSKKQRNPKGKHKS
jgi:hypothetical protein